MIETKLESRPGHLICLSLLCVLCIFFFLFFSHNKTHHRFLNFPFGLLHIATWVSRRNSNTLSTALMHSEFSFACSSSSAIHLSLFNSILWGENNLRGVESLVFT